MALLSKIAHANSIDIKDDSNHKGYRQCREVGFMKSRKKPNSVSVTGNGLELFPFGKFCKKSSRKKIASGKKNSRGSKRPSLITKYTGSYINKKRNSNIIPTILGSKDSSFSSSISLSSKIIRPNQVLSTLPQSKKYDLELMNTSDDKLEVTDDDDNGEDDSKGSVTICLDAPISVVIISTESASDNNAAHSRCTNRKDTKSKVKRMRRTTASSSLRRKESKIDRRLEKYRNEEENEDNFEANISFKMKELLLDHNNDIKNGSSCRRKTRRNNRNGQAEAQTTTGTKKKKVEKKMKKKEVPQERAPPLRTLSMVLPQHSKEQKNGYLQQRTPPIRALSLNTGQAEAQTTTGTKKKKVEKKKKKKKTKEVPQERAPPLRTSSMVLPQDSKEQKDSYLQRREPPIRALSLNIPRGEVHPRVILSTKIQRKSSRRRVASALFSKTNKVL